MLAITFPTQRITGMVRPAAHQRNPFDKGAYPDLQWINGHECGRYFLTA